MYEGLIFSPFATPSVVYTRISGVACMYGLGWKRYGHTLDKEAYDILGHLVYIDHTSVDWWPI